MKSSGKTSGNDEKRTSRREGISLAKASWLRLVNGTSGLYVVRDVEEVAGDTDEVVKDILEKARQYRVDE